MSKRTTRKLIAEETVQILSRGEYQTAAGNRVSIQPALQRSIDGTICYTPDAFDKTIQQSELTRTNASIAFATRFEVLNTTTFTASKQLVGEDSTRHVVCLNFASAKNPGGGFLGGSQAQEECLARASGLYACINPQQKYYEANRSNDTCLYTDHIIYSPEVPVFRNDEDELLDEPYYVSLLTAPAVNAGAVTNNEPENISQIAGVMLRRMECLLSIALLHGHDTLVLGAWGCGVFKNDPGQVAQWFHQLLCAEGRFRNAFQTVTFAVLDNTEEKTTIEPFRRFFNSVSAS